VPGRTGAREQRKGKAASLRKGIGWGHTELQKDRPQAKGIAGGSKEAVLKRPARFPKREAHSGEKRENNTVEGWKRTLDRKQNP